MSDGIFEGWGQDLKYAWRGLLQQPGFSALAMLTLALGLGTTTAIFSVVYGVLLQPLPYAQPDRLMTVWEVNHSGNHARLAEPNFDDFRDQNHSFTALARYWSAIVPVTGMAEPERVNVAVVSRDFFKVLETAPAIGRGFTPDETRPGAQPTALVSHDFWRKHLSSMGGDTMSPDLAAVHLRVEGRDYAVVGILPAGFEFPAKADVWVPAELTPRTTSRTAHNFSAIGRLRDGVSAAEASDDLNAIAHRIVRETSEQNDYLLRGAGAGPLQTALTGRMRSPLYLLLGAVGFLLLVACANVAHFLLARASKRGRELAIRRALGAGQRRLVRQFITEAFLLSGISAAAGVLIAAGAVRVLLALAPPELPRLDEIAIRWPVLALAAGLALTIAAGLGLATASRSASVDRTGGLAGALIEGGRGSAGTRRGQRASRAIVAAQLAVTLVLLAGAALLGRSLLAVLSIDPGFRTDSMLVMDVDPAAVDEPDAAAVKARESQLVSRLLERLSALPGVEQVAAANTLPLDGGLPDGQFLLVNERENPRNFQEFSALAKQPERRGTADFCVVTSGYFRALAIPLRRGRGFEARDAMNAPHVAIISESLARSRWPNQDPLGQTLQFGNMDGDMHLLTIVGIAADTREEGPESPPRPIVYGNLLQRPRSAFSVVIHSANDSPALVADARAILRSEAPTAPPRFRSFAQMYTATLGSRRFNLVLVGFFALAALLLAVAGAYGVAAYGVAQRTREIGVRMALGAKPAEVVSLILREEARTALAGVVIGGLCALALTRTIQALLFGVSATDPVTLVSVAALLTAVTGVACFVPARRATRIDPLVALREE
ncbi:MAG TPA: ABC transporter permease [Vicinamibacterales bacterium]|nr:ABC transporter permease [Vicinamibacterales bacterium]